MKLKQVERIFRATRKWILRNNGQARLATVAPRVESPQATPDQLPEPAVTPDPTAMQIALSLLGPGSLTIADVGARWGAEAAWFRLKPLARLFGFEPDPIECARLNERAVSEEEQFVPMALGQQAGQATLHVTREPACSSLYPPSLQMIERYPSLRPIMSPVTTRVVPLSTLEAWAREAQVERVDFIKLDTQGSELDILQGAGSLLGGCLGIEVEVSFDRLYEGQPLFADVDTYLRSRGFKLWRLDNLAHYTDHPSDRLTGLASVHHEHKAVYHASGDGRLIWANAIYFRDRGELSQSFRDLIALAVLLEAAGDHDGSRCCLEWAWNAPDLPDNAPQFRGKSAVTTNPAETPAERFELQSSDPKANLTAPPLTATLERGLGNSLVRFAIVSSPRSGSTWLRLMLAKAYGLEQVAVFNPHDLDWTQLPTRCVLHTHWHRVESLLSLLKQHNFRVVSLARHPLDVLISILHFAPHEPETARWLEGEGGSETGILRASPRSNAFLEYATGPRASSLLSVSREWWQAPGSLQVRYEDLVREPAEVLKRLGQAVECLPPADAVIAATATTSMEALRKTSCNQHFWRGRPGNWRSLLPASLAQRIAHAHRASLDELGYECNPDESLSDSQADANWEKAHD